MTKLIGLKIDDKLLETFDTVCQDVPRSVYIRRLIRNEIAAVNGVHQDQDVYGKTNSPQDVGVCNG